MKRAVVAAALVAASCGTATPPALEHADARPYRDLPDVPRRTVTELPEQYALPKRVKVSRSRPRPPARNSTPAGGGDVWAALARCESGGNATSRSANGLYTGAFQFLDATWQSLGYSGEAADHPYATQLAGAQRLQARSGWGQWPRCARRLGLL